jgi:hypothetical protein
MHAHALCYEAILVDSSLHLDLILLPDYCTINSLASLALYHYVLSFYILRYVVLCPACACRCGNSTGFASLPFDQLKRIQRTFCPLIPDLPRLSEAGNPGTCSFMSFLQSSHGLLRCPASKDVPPPKTRWPHAIPDPTTSKALMEPRLGTQKPGPDGAQYQGDASLACE